MWTGEWEEVVSQIVARFNESQERVRVRPLVVTGDANTKLLLAIAGGAPPDLMAQWNQVIPAWAHKKALTPLDSLMSREEYAALQRWLYPASRAIGTYEGRLYAFCTCMNAWSLMLNVKMLREAGYDPERPPRTLAELDAMGAKLYRDDARGKLDRVGFLPTGIHHWGTVFGGEFYDPVQRRVTANHPRIVKALEWMVSYSKRYDINKIVSFQAGLTQTIGDTYPFIGQKFAMLVDGQWRVEDMRKFAPRMEYQVTPIPYPPGGRPKASWVNGNFMIVPRGAKHPREALEFAKFWAGWGNEAVGAEIATMAGWIPAGPSVARQPAYQAYMKRNPHFRTWLEVAGSPNVRITPVIPVQAFYWDRLQAAEEAALRLQKTPQEALDQCTYEVQRELDKVLARG
jgi:multiple sugar transport system substrate-binding protein